MAFTLPLLAWRIQVVEAAVAQMLPQPKKEECDPELLPTCCELEWLAKGMKLGILAASTLIYWAWEVSSLNDCEVNQEREEQVNSLIVKFLSTKMPHAGTGWHIKLALILPNKKHNSKRSDRGPNNAKKKKKNEQRKREKFTLSASHHH